VVKAVDPSLGVRLSSLDRSDVGGLSVVVPSEGLDEIELVPVGDEGFPSRSVEPFVGSEDPVLVPAVDSVVGEEGGGDGGLGREVKGKGVSPGRFDGIRLRKSEGVRRLTMYPFDPRAFM